MTTPAALAATNLTLVDIVKRKDPNGQISPFVELLAKQSAVIEDMVWKEGNLDTGHRIVARNALPTVYWRKLNQGVAPSKSGTTSYTEACGMLEGRSQVDVEIVNLNGGAAARASEDASFVEALSQTFESAVFYENSKTNEERIEGLSPRFSAVSGQGGKQIVLGGSTTSQSDCTSIWGVCWGEGAVYGVFPKGQSAGLQYQDRGMQTISDSSGNRLDVFEGRWTWKCGLAVEDYRQIARIPNIDTGQLTTAGTGTNDTKLVDKMISAYYKINNPKKGKFVWYCNRLIAEVLHKQARADVVGGTLSIEMIEGKPVTVFMGAPVRITDAITNTESNIALT